jgi:all-trans-retinol 13,14-reductase
MEAEQHFDIVIIGSGMGGLFTAYTLADFGFKVCVLEKNQQLGGSLQVFSRDKTIFDTGVHYIGSLDPDQNLGKFFKYAGIYDMVQWQKMDTIFDKVSFSGDDTEYPVAQGPDNYITELSKHFPENKADIEAYVKKLKDTCGHFPLLSLEYEDHNYHVEEFASENVKDVINGITDNPKLQQVLSGQEILYGGRADQTPFYVHALVVYGYMQSSYKCVGGGSNIAKAMAKRIRAKGGELIKRAKVTSFEMEDGKIKTAVTSDGNRYSADSFISNIHPKNTFDLLPTEAIKRPYYKRIAKLENSVSSFTVHIKFKPKSFKYLNYNHYHNRTNDPWDAPHYTAENWPLSMFICTPVNHKDPEYADAMSIMVYMRYEEVEKWADTNNTIVEPGSRGSEYDEWCKMKGQKVIDATCELLPELREAMKGFYTSSPLTYRDYIGNDDGSMYGILKNHHHPIKTFIPPKSKVPNLYLTGQNINLHGILGVTISALATATQFVDRKELIDRLRAS